MADVRLDRLTEAQRACLRLIGEGLEAKEIAIALGITPAAVTERLRAARQKLDVATSKQAARLLRAAEDASSDRPYNRIVDSPAVIVPAPYPEASSAGPDDREVHETVAPFGTSSGPPRWPHTRPKWVRSGFFDKPLVIVLLVIVATVLLAVSVAAVTQTVVLMSGLVSPNP